MGRGCSAQKQNWKIQSAMRLCVSSSSVGADSGVLYHRSFEKAICVGFFQIDKCCNIDSDLLYYRHSVRFNEWNTKRKANCAGQDDAERCRAKYEIEKQFPHPSYSISNPSKRHDIGLLKTKVNVEFTEFVRPICLPFSETFRDLRIEGDYFTVTGWGQTDQSICSHLCIHIVILIIVYYH